jgi:energy-coupling factor transporter transmembrane protein EcfT
MMRCNVISKIVFATSFIIVAASLWDPLVGVVLLSTSILLSVVLAKLPVKEVWNAGFKYVSVGALFAAIPSAFYYGPPATLKQMLVVHRYPDWLMYTYIIPPISSGTIQIYYTLGGLFIGIGLVLRAFIIVFSFWALLYSTPFLDLSSLFLKLRMPQQFVVIAALIYRLIPSTVSNFQTTQQAQRSRGLELNGRILFLDMVKGRGERLTAIMRPLLNYATLIAVDQVGMALESRGYGAGPISSTIDLKKIGKNDLLLFCFSILFVLGYYLGNTFIGLGSL